MKITKLKIIGIVLLAGTLLAAALMQVFGSGLVVTEHLNQHIQSSDPHVVYGGTVITTYHMMRILPLVACAIVGMAFVFLSRRHEKPVA